MCGTRPIERCRQCLSHDISTHTQLTAAVTFTLQDVSLSWGNYKLLLKTCAYRRWTEHGMSCSLTPCQFPGAVLMLQLALQLCAFKCDLQPVQVEVQALHITRQDLPDADASPEQWQTLMGTPIDTPMQNNFIMLCDPSFSQVPDLISGGHLQAAQPRQPQTSAHSC